jgi:hypothetical protein
MRVPDGRCATVGRRWLRHYGESVAPRSTDSSRLWRRICAARAVLCVLHKTAGRLESPGLGRWMGSKRTLRRLSHCHQIAVLHRRLTARFYSRTGKPGIDPVVLFKLALLGLNERHRGRCITHHRWQCTNHGRFRLVFCRDEILRQSHPRSAQPNGIAAGASRPGPALPAASVLPWPRCAGIRPYTLWRCK